MLAALDLYREASLFVGLAPQSLDFSVAHAHDGHYLRARRLEQLGRRHRDLRLFERRAARQMVKGDAKLVTTESEEN